MTISVHSDEPTDRDSLGRDQYAQAFAHLTELCDTPLVIGLYGSWGMGKTSLMRLIQAKLDPSKSRTVWFDPWLHQFDETPAISLMHTMVDAFGMREEARKLITVITAAFGSILLKASTTLSVKDIDELGRRYEEERFEVREARIRLQYHFRQLILKAQCSAASLNEAIPNIEQHRNVLHGISRRFQRWRKRSLSSTGEKVSGSRRIVFFIDDLDRCSSANVLSMLESLKLHLNIPGCVYFLAMDRTSVERILAAKGKDSAACDESYLDKIIQLPFTIPPIAQGSMRHFVEPLLSQDLRVCGALLVKGLGDNPRNVKRFINTLTLNHELAKGLKIPGYSPLILALLLLLVSS